MRSAGERAESAVGAGHDVLPSQDAREPFDAPGDELWVPHEVGRGVMIQRLHADGLGLAEFLYGVVRKLMLRFMAWSGARSAVATLPRRQPGTLLSSHLPGEEVRLRRGVAAVGNRILDRSRRRRAAPRHAAIGV